MKIKIGSSEQTIKEKNYIVAELWTKMKTIRDDKKYAIGLFAMVRSDDAIFRNF